MTKEVFLGSPSEKHFPEVFLILFACHTNGKRFMNRVLSLKGAPKGDNDNGTVFRTGI